MLEEIFRWYETQITALVTVGAILFAFVLISSVWIEVEHYITSLYNGEDQ